MKKILLSITILCSLVFSCKKEDAEPDILKVYNLTETVNGLTASDLEAISSKWLLGTSQEQSAANDESGNLAVEGLQPNANVTILPYNFGGVSNRKLTIKASKPVYIPILGFVYWYWDNDPCDPDFKPASGQSSADFLRPYIDELLLAPHTVSAKFNGTDIVPDIKKYLAKSGSFDLEIPLDYQDPKCDNNGKLAHAISHGYALLLKLPKGKHILSYKGAFPNEDPALDFKKLK
jgi:hypothetical protein